MPKRGNKPWKNYLMNNQDPNFIALKKLRSQEVLVYLARIYNPALTYHDLAIKFNISDKTAFDYCKRVKESDFIDETKQALYRFKEKLLSAVDTLLEEPDGFVTIKILEGMGILTPSVVIEDKRSPEEFKKNLITETNRLLGSRLDMTVIDLPKAQEGVQEAQGEEIRETLKNDSSSGENEA